MMAVRRGQEYKYEIIRKRARTAKTKNNEEMNATRPTHKFTEGNFVMLKDFSPAHKGEKKLRSKWRGPMRIIKALATTLVVIPWTETAADIGELVLPTARFQKRAKGAAGNRPLHYEFMSTKNCKPYKGPVGQCLDYDPLLVDRFLHELNNDWELQTPRTFVESEADFRSHHSEHKNDPNYDPNDDAESDSSDHDSGPSAPDSILNNAPNAPQNDPDDSSDQESDQDQDPDYQPDPTTPPPHQDSEAESSIEREEEESDPDEEPEEYPPPPNLQALAPPINQYPPDAYYEDVVPTAAAEPLP
jgi:hypothetical protein